jgi:mannose-1-phosphate guanylyltransferase
VALDGAPAGEGRVVGPALVSPGCHVEAGARVGGRVVLGEGVRVGAGTTIERAVVLEGAQVGAHCSLHGCIVGAGARIGDHCVIDGLSVLGAGVEIGAGNVLSHGVRLFPDVSLPDHSIAF